jgi:glycosyltransferase involved in cell wall biosynthesis
LRILQLAPRLPYPLTDGGAIGIYKPTEAVAQLGHEITFVTFPDNDSSMTEEAVRKLSQFCRVKLVSRPLPSRNVTLLRTIFSGAYPIERRMMPEMYKLLEQIISDGSFDIVHIDGAQMGKYGLWMKERFGLPVVLREHNFETLIYRRFSENAKNPLAKIITAIQSKRVYQEETTFLAGMDGIVAISSEDQRLMAEAVPKGKYRIVPAGVDVNYFHPQPHEMEEDSILWIGGMDWEPNKDAVEFFVKEIFPLIVERFPYTTFDIAGKGTESLSSLASVPNGRIRLHGRVPDVRTLIAKAKVVICPLRVGGGMRLKLLDFFASGKALVSTRIGAEGNRGEDNRHFMLRDDPRSFAEAVKILLDNNELRYTLGRNARKLAEEMYSWHSIARQFERVYEEVLSSR